MYLKMKTEDIMNRNYYKDGYSDTIRKGLSAIRAFDPQISHKDFDRNENIEKLKEELNNAEAIVIGAGAGLSTSAGFIYTGQRFERYFWDFIDEYHFNDMYSGGFYPYETSEEFWGYWSRYIYINRYMDAPKPVYRELLDLVKDKEYFVITTNVDHCFQKAGFDKKRLFYTQGDYGLFQCSKPCHDKTYDNEETVRKMALSQGFEFSETGDLIAKDWTRIKREISSDLIPYCPVCGEAMTMNLRSDDTFVQDEGWYQASSAYAKFLQENEGKHILFLELGVGNNTPVIIKYPFWAMVDENRNSVYACLNYNEAYTPKQIEERSICIDGDIGEVLNLLKGSE